MTSIISEAEIGYELAKAPSTASRRRESFSLSVDDDRDEIAELKHTVSNELERRKSVASIGETVPEVAVTSRLPTPIGEMSETSDEEDQRGGITYGSKEEVVFEEHDGHVKRAPAVNKNEMEFDHAHHLMDPPSRDEITQTEHTEKNTSATEDEDAMLDSASLVERPTPENKTSSKTPTRNTKGMLRTPTSTRSTTVKSKTPVSRLSVGPQSTPKGASPGTTRSAPPFLVSPKSGSKSSSQPNISPRLMAPTASSTARSEHPPSPKEPKAPAARTTKASVPSNLLRSTAATAAKHEQQEKVESKSAPSRPRKSTELSSRLLAPTASSAAKHDSTVQTAKPEIVRKASVPANKDKPNQGAKTSRSSLAPTQGIAPTLKRSESRVVSSGSATNSSKPPTGDGFLARMMRPTAASSGKTQSKADPKSPPAAPVGVPHTASLRRAPSTRDARPVITSKKSALSSNGTSVKTAGPKKSTPAPGRPAAKETAKSSESSEGAVNTPQQSEDGGSGGLRLRGLSETPDFGALVIR